MLLPGSSPLLSRFMGRPDVILFYSFRHLPLTFAMGQIKHAVGAEGDSCFFAFSSMFITNSSLTDPLFFFSPFPYVLVDFRHKNSGGNLYLYGSLTSS